MVSKRPESDQIKRNAHASTPTETGPQQPSSPNKVDRPKPPETAVLEHAQPCREVKPDFRSVAAPEAKARLLLSALAGREQKSTGGSER
jgi:hypothetical protein